MRGHRIMAITSAFQADDAGSIPAARSNIYLLPRNSFLSYSVESEGGANKQRQRCCHVKFGRRTSLNISFHSANVTLIGLKLFTGLEMP